MVSGGIAGFPLCSVLVFWLFDKCCAEKGRLFGRLGLVLVQSVLVYYRENWLGFSSEHHRSCEDSCCSREFFDGGDVCYRGFRCGFGRFLGFDDQVFVGSYNFLQRWLFKGWFGFSVEVCGEEQRVLKMKKGGVEVSIEFCRLCNLFDPSLEIICIVQWCAALKIVLEPSQNIVAWSYIEPISRTVRAYKHVSATNSFRRQ